MSKETKQLIRMGVIPDGNRRWAKSKNLPTLEGHEKGMKKVKEVGEWCKERRVFELTLYIFSTENWGRSNEEVNYLMDMFSELSSEESIKDFRDKKVRIRIAGRKDEKVSEDLRRSFEKIESATEEFSDLTINLAFNYGGRSEIVAAAKKVTEKGERLTEESLKKNLHIENYPDLIIRTGKEKRLSNFLLWQAAYSELYFSDTLWPDFSKEEFEKIIDDYESRERRFGK